MAFFTPFNFVTLCQLYCTTSAVSFSKLHQETIEWEGKRFFAYMAASAYHVISAEVENYIFKHDWIFRHFCIYKQPTLTKWNFNIFVQILCTVVVSDTVVGTFLDVLFLSLAVILSELYEKTRRKDWATEKSK